MDGGISSMTELLIFIFIKLDLYVCLLFSFITLRDFDLEGLVDVWYAFFFKYRSRKLCLIELFPFGNPLTSSWFEFAI